MLISIILILTYLPVESHLPRNMALYEKVASLLYRNISLLLREIQYQLVIVVHQDLVKILAWQSYRPQLYRKCLYMFLLVTGRQINSPRSMLFSGIQHQLVIQEDITFVIKEKLGSFSPEFNISYRPFGVKFSPCFSRS